MCVCYCLLLVPAIMPMSNASIRLRSNPSISTSPLTTMIQHLCTTSNVTCGKHSLTGSHSTEKITTKHGNSAEPSNKVVCTLFPETVSKAQATYDHVRKLVQQEILPMLPTTRQFSAAGQLVSKLRLFNRSIDRQNQF